ncbi:MAG: HemK2/MTQ2 family protein methyltransferase [Vicinamibacteria bacterium]
MNPLVAATRRVAHILWHFRVRASLSREDAFSGFGLDLVIAPGVLHPRHFASSRLLAEYLATVDLHGKRVADIGTGSGLLALLAARAGATVTAIDISPAAVRCATSNARRNELVERIDVIESDVFDRVPTALRYDVVVTNPPFYSRNAESPADHAFAAGGGNGFFAKLAESLPTRLAKGGVAVMIQSSDADFAPLARMFAAVGFEGRVVRERRGLFETLTIREFRATA